MRAAFQAVISGRVQYVGYRAFTQEQAHRLGLVGYVRNLLDGTVEVFAEGERYPLQLLLEKLHAGPAGAEVEKVAVSWTDPTGMFRDFTISYD